MKLERNFSLVITTTFILFSNLLIFSESQTTTIKTTGNNCSVEDDYAFCGRNAFCDLTSGRCTCNLGYKMTPKQKDPNQFHCTVYQCRDSAQCRRQFARSVCWPGAGFCICEASYWWDPGFQGCRPIRAAPGDVCSSNVDCGLDAYCDQNDDDENEENEFTCRCVPGAQPRDPGNVNCCPMKCGTFKDENLNCPPKSICDKKSGRCLPDGTVQLGDVPCGSDEDCLVVQGSKKGKWRCHLLSSPVAGGGNRTGFCLRGETGVPDGDRFGKNNNSSTKGHSKSDTHAELSLKTIGTLLTILVIVKKIFLL